MCSVQKRKIRRVGHNDVTHDSSKSAAQCARCITYRGSRSRCGCARSGRRALSSGRGQVQLYVAIQVIVRVTAVFIAVARANSVAVADILLIRGCVVGAPALLSLDNGKRIVVCALVVAVAIRLEGVCVFRSRQEGVPNSNIWKCIPCKLSEPVFWLEQ